MPHLAPPGQGYPARAYPPMGHGSPYDPNHYASKYGQSSDAGYPPTSSSQGDMPRTASLDALASLDLPGVQSLESIGIPMGGAGSSHSLTHSGPPGFFPRTGSINRDGAENGEFSPRKWQSFGSFGSFPSFDSTEGGRKQGDPLNKRGPRSGGDDTTSGADRPNPTHRTPEDPGLFHATSSGNPSSGSVGQASLDSHQPGPGERQAHPAQPKEAPQVSSNRAPEGAAEGSRRPQQGQPQPNRDMQAPRANESSAMNPPASQSTPMRRAPSGMRLHASGMPRNSSVDDFLSLVESGDIPAPETDMLSNPIFQAIQHQGQAQQGERMSTTGKRHLENKPGPGRSKSQKAR